ncbi:hypothetical protein ABXV22_25725 [Vibrio rotiferianus]|uniref:hypothetical protein n=1 Tax=Vibrio rotiferianus TaxID=190895 RepID=UPI003390EB56
MKRTTQPYVYDGHVGLVAIAKACGVPLGTVKTRMRRGYSLEEALSHQDFREFNTGEAFYEWNGARGIRAIAEKADVSQVAIFNHLNQGRTINQAIECIYQTKERIAKAKVKSPKQKQEIVGITKPDLLGKAWKIALGVSV